MASKLQWLLGGPHGIKISPQIGATILSVELRKGFGQLPQCSIRYVIKAGATRYLEKIFIEGNWFDIMSMSVQPAKFGFIVSASGIHSAHRILKSWSEYCVYYYSAPYPVETNADEKTIPIMKHKVSADIWGDKGWTVKEILEDYWDSVLKCNWKLKFDDSLPPVSDVYVYSWAIQPAPVATILLSLINKVFPTFGAHSHHIWAEGNKIVIGSTTGLDVQTFKVDTSLRITTSTNVAYAPHSSGRIIIDGGVKKAPGPQPGCISSTTKPSNLPDCNSESPTEDIKKFESDVGSNDTGGNEVAPAYQKRTGEEWVPEDEEGRNRIKASTGMIEFRKFVNLPNNAGKMIYEKTIQQWDVKYKNAAGKDGLVYETKITYEYCQNYYPEGKKKEIQQMSGLAFEGEGKNAPAKWIENLYRKEISYTYSTTKSKDKGKTFAVQKLLKVVEIVSGAIGCSAMVETGTGDERVVTYKQAESAVHTINNAKPLIIQNVDISKMERTFTEDGNSTEVWHDYLQNKMIEPKHGRQKQAVIKKARCLGWAEPNVKKIDPVGGESVIDPKKEYSFVRIGIIPDANSLENIAKWYEEMRNYLYVEHNSYTLAGVFFASVMAGPRWQVASNLDFQGNKGMTTITNKKYTTELTYNGELEIGQDRINKLTEQDEKDNEPEWEIPDPAFRS